MSRGKRNDGPFTTRDEFTNFVHSAHRPALDVVQGADVLIASTFVLTAVDAALDTGCR